MTEKRKKTYSFDGKPGHECLGKAKFIFLK
jgi:hypothetical protein